MILPCTSKTGTLSLFSFDLNQNLKYYLLYCWVPFSIIIFFFKSREIVKIYVTTEYFKFTYNISHLIQEKDNEEVFLKENVKEGAIAPLRLLSRKNRRGVRVD